MSDIVTDEDVEEALDYLRDNAVRAAKAIAYGGYMDDYTRVIKARLMGQSNEPVVAAQERYAYAHADYEKHLQDKQTAVEKAEAAKFLMKEKGHRIEAWKTLNYRNRIMEKI